MTEPQLNIPVPFEVHAENPWHQTDVLLTKGHVYRFDVPKEQVWHDGWSLRNISPDGGVPWWCWWLRTSFATKGLRMPEAPWFCLVGSVNSNEPYFVIGSFLKEYTPTETGELICCANDWPSRDGHHYKKNNEGVMKGTVTRIG